MQKKAAKKSKRKGFKRKLNKLVQRNLVFFLVFILAAFGLSQVQSSQNKNIFSGQKKNNAVIVLDDISDETLKLCYFEYSPKTPYDYNDIGFLYAEDDVVHIAKSETIDAEYIEQALAVDEDADNVSYKIASLVSSDVSTYIKPKDEMYKSLSHIEKSDLAEKKSYELYEEELPEGAVKDEFKNIGHSHEDGYHIYNRHKNIRELEISIYKKPYYFGPKPVIAVVIDDMGINHQRTRDISRLKAPLTASFLTYGASLKAQVAKSQEAGHEIMVHVPMEPKRKANIAPDTLTTDMDEAEIKNSLSAMLKKFKGVRGINNHMGSQFTEDGERMNYVMEVLHDHDLFFLDSKTSARSKGHMAAKANNVPYAHRHVFLDNENDVEYINKQLRLAEKIAKKNGYVVAIGHPKSKTYIALKEWLPTLNDKNIKLVHLSEIIKVLNQSIIVNRENRDEESNS